MNLAFCIAIHNEIRGSMVSIILVKKAKVHLLAIVGCVIRPCIVCILWVSVFFVKLTISAYMISPALQGFLWTVYTRNTASRYIFILLLFLDHFSVPRR